MDLKKARGRKPFAVAFVIVLVAAGAAVTSSVAAQTSPGLPFEVQSLNGGGNNTANPTFGQAGNNYSRVAAPRYADGVGEPVQAPNPRAISNRVFNDSHQNLFSERNVTQWGFAWGQFLDHTFGLRQGRGPDDPVGEQAPIPFDQNDPIEEFQNDLGVIPFERSARAPGTGETTPREQVNTVSSYIDAFAVYGPNNTRLEWLRNGPVDGNLANNSGQLLLPDGYLPRGGDRSVEIPEVELGGRLTGNAPQATIAGDIRSNENIALTSTHTLFAREHNRIVGQLPSSLTEEQKFQIARRVVMAEQQYITYNEFLPTMGVTMPAYTGYRPNINTDLGNEFATVGYRAHSMIHGELELETNLDRYSPEDLAALEELGVEIEAEPGAEEGEIIIPLNLAFFNPDLLELVQLGPMLQGLGLEAQYNNDDQIDNQLRSVLFQIPVSENPECLDGEGLPECFDGVVDLGAIDIERGFDHGMPSYNQLRRAYGLPAVTSFTQITGESTADFPPGLGIDDPESLEFVELRDIDGNLIDLNDEDAVDGDARTGVRATTLAARLRAIFGNVNNVDAFTGMLSEAHLPGADFGPLQLAIWSREFTRLRDGDRFFFGNQLPALNQLRDQYGIDFRTNLGDVIARNTDIPRDELNENVFLVDDADAPTTCNVGIRVVSQGSLDFVAAVDITNTSASTIAGWSLDFRFQAGQVLLDSWNANFAQSGPNVTVSVPANHWQGTLAPGETATGWMRGSWDRAVNPRPTHFSLNGGRCTT